MSDSIIVGTNAKPTNPTPLSAPQEQQVRDLYYKNVRSKCAAEIECAYCNPFPRLFHSQVKAFAQCALGRTLTMIYVCRAPRLAMNACMLQYQNQDELDAARQEWFALADERQRQREEHARRLENARKQHKEWWGLDASGGKASDAQVQRKEENRTDGTGVTRGGIYRGT